MSGTRDADAAALGWMAQTVTGSLPGTSTDGAVVSLAADDGMREVLFATDGVAGGLEELQFTIGEGPCVDAASTGSAVLIDDLADGGGPRGRWPVFAAEAVQVGVRAMFAFPIRIGAVRLGTCAFYRSGPGPLGSADLAAALTTVDQVALAVLGLRAGGPDGLASGDATWSSMAVHRAAGMVMVQMGSSIEEALLRLRATAFVEDTPISQVAADVVSGRRRFPKERS